MLIGAVMGFWTVQRVHAGAAVTLFAAVLVAAIAGAAMALIHAFMVITLRANQIVSGLALTIFAGSVGLSSYLGSDLNLADLPAAHTFHAVFPKSMQAWPVVGPIVFAQNALVYLSWLCVIGVSYYLMHTRPGLNLRAVGEAPGAADAMGISVTKYRYAHTLVGGALQASPGRRCARTDAAVVNGSPAAWAGSRSARNLRVLAPGAVSRRRVLLRLAAGARARVAGAQHLTRPDRALDERVAVHRDDRRARVRLVARRCAPTRRARRARHLVRAGGSVTNRRGTRRRRSRSGRRLALPPAAPQRTSSSSGSRSASPASANDRHRLLRHRGRGARAPRRERRRQVDALAHPQRALPPGRGRDPAGRRAGRVPLPARRDRRRRVHGAPALPARRALHRGRKSDPRRPPRCRTQLPAPS